MRQSETLELYKLFVDSASKITEARSKANAFFVTLNTAIIGANGFVGADALLMVGLFINLLWFVAIGSYRCLNAAKFQIINEIEQDLKYQCFNKEYEICKKLNRADFSKIENKMPLCFIMFFLFMIYIKYRVYIINGINMITCW